MSEESDSILCIYCHLKQRKRQGQISYCVEHPDGKYLLLHPKTDRAMQGVIDRNESERIICTSKQIVNTLNCFEKLLLECYASYITHNAFYTVCT